MDRREIVSTVVRRLCAVVMGVVFVSTAIGDDGEFFESKVRPTLVSRCVGCHGVDRAEGGLGLNDQAGLVAGRVEAGFVLEAARWDVSHGDIEFVGSERVDLMKWVKGGAVWPEVVLRDEAEGGDHWAFVKVGKVEVPDAVAGGGGGGSGNAIDRFLAAPLLEKGLTPNGAADKRTLIRRATFDLTGLPPEPGDIAAFLSDESDGAFGRVVDRLLASEEYGRHWGRFWLDLARYADTAGDTSDYPIPEAYLYRDYVVHAFNDDMPYDQFVVEQIAGDLLARQTPGEGFDQKIIATGFVAMAPQFGPKLRQNPHLMIENTISTIGESMLGLTIGCARCHDHKFEPITVEDYYGWYGYFQSTVYPHAGSEEAPRAGGLAPLTEDAELRGEYVKHSEAVAKIGNHVLLGKRSRKQEHTLAEYKVMLAELDANEPRVTEAAFAVRDLSTPSDAKIHLRGEPGRLGDVVPRGFIGVIGDGAAPVIPKGQSGRLELAQWIGSGENPLTARVMVNRIWHKHFGKGLVRTLSNFGVQGATPTHGELLDYLAGRFVEDGWSIKKMHRLMMSSAAYQRSSLPNDSNGAIDSSNQWYWRFDRRRLSAEEVRDGVLWLSGQLDFESGGAHPFPDKKKWGDRLHYTQHRPFHAVYPSNKRSVFLMTQRLHEHPILGMFDPPNRSIAVPERRVSTVPLQSLFLMNSVFVRDNAAAFAQRMMAMGGTVDDRLRRGHELAWGRVPSEADLAGGVEYLKAARLELAKTGLGAKEIEKGVWTGYARVLLTSNAYFYVD